MFEEISPLTFFANFTLPFQLLLSACSLCVPKKAKHKAAPSDPNIKYIFAVPQPQGVISAKSVWEQSVGGKKSL